MLSREDSHLRCEDQSSRLEDSDWVTPMRNCERAFHSHPVDDEVGPWAVFMFVEKVPTTGEGILWVPIQEVHGGKGWKRIPATGDAVAQRGMG